MTPILPSGQAEAVTPEQALEEARGGKLRPIYLIVGEERYLSDQVCRALRDATLQGGIQGFNEDKFSAGDCSAEALISAARTAPMMAARRLVLARGLERWEKKGDDSEVATGEKLDGHKQAGPLDRLAEYAKDPVASTVLLLCASKLNGQRRLVTMAKKAGFLVDCEPLSRRDLPAFITRLAREKGHAMSGEAAELLAEVAGPELGYVADAVERLSLFVGEGTPISEEAIANLVTRVRQGTVWELVGQVYKRLEGNG